MKTYCISDVHGHYKNLKKFIETLKEDDRVFVLGDVVDKGKEPIHCLLTIMNDKRFTMLLGNHEHMMYCYLTADENSFERLWMEEEWIDFNGGKDTMKDSRKYSETDRENILGFIHRLSLNIPDLEVNGKHFYLVHSNPVTLEAKKFSDYESDDEAIGEFVWERRSPFDRLYFNDRTVIAGHTPIQAYTDDYKTPVKPYADSDNLLEAHYIDIDGGLAADLENSKLIALCLDDMSYQLY